MHLPTSLVSLSHEFKAASPLLLVVPAALIDFWEGEWQFWAGEQQQQQQEGGGEGDDSKAGKQAPINMVGKGGLGWEEPSPLVTPVLAAWMAARFAFWAGRR